MKARSYHITGVDYKAKFRTAEHLKARRSMSLKFNNVAFGAFVLFTIFYFAYGILTSVPLIQR